jgi:hypothetical protein
MAARNTLTEAEVEYLDAGLDKMGEHFRGGKMDGGCPRCAGDLQASVAPSGYAIWCSRCEVQMTARGI